jgi:hypothetical protein
MIRIGLLLSLIALAVWLYAVFDSLTADAEKVRVLQKPLWVVIVLLFNVLGAVAWLMWGRPRVAPGGGDGGWGGGWGGGGHPSGPAGPQGPRRRARPRPIAPDDDPDFLKSL